MYGIAQTWNRAGVRTTFDNEWTAASVRQVLVNPRYGGLRAHNGVIVGAAAWEGVVDEETWRAAERVMKAPGRRRHHPMPGRRYLLSGLAVCGRCGDTMTSGLTHHGTRTYRCRRFHLSRAGEPIDAFVERIVVARLNRPDGRALLTPPPAEGPDLAGEAAELRRRLDMMAAEFGSDPSVGPAEYRSMRQPVVDRLVDLERQMEAAGPAPDLAGFDEAVDAGEWWAGLSLDLRRAVVAMLMRVMVHPAVRGRRGFDPALIDVEWLG